MILLCGLRGPFLKPRVEPMEAEWVMHDPEHDDDGPLWQLVRADGVVLWETDSRPTKAGNRELSREWEVEIR